MNNIQSGNRLFLRCCYGFAINGMAVLVIGSILPSLMSEAGLGFAAAGGMYVIQTISPSQRQHYTV